MCDTTLVCDVLNSTTYRKTLGKIATKVIKEPLFCTILQQVKDHLAFLTTPIHDDVIKWKHFPRNWPFVRGIHLDRPVTQRPVTRSFDVFFDLRLNKRLSKQPWGWWFETLSWSLWRHCNESNQGLYSLSRRRLSWSLQATRFGFRLCQSLWNLTGTPTAALSRCLSNFRAIRSL